MHKVSDDSGICSVDENVNVAITGVGLWLKSNVYYSKNAGNKDVIIKNGYGLQIFLNPNTGQIALYRTKTSHKAGDIIDDWEITILH